MSVILKCSHMGVCSLIENIPSLRNVIFCCFIIFKSHTGTNIDLSQYNGTSTAFRSNSSFVSLIETDTHTLLFSSMLILSGS